MSEQGTPADALAKLASIRRSIDNIDAALIHILAERFRCTQQVGQLKADAGLPASDPQREQQQVARLRELARAADLDPEFAEKFLSFVIAEVINHHERIAAESGGAQGGN
nr:chorismate mutase [Pseudoclavibacter sp. Marseille-Q3772]